METILVNWRDLSPQIQLVIFDIGKVALLVIITLICINKIRQWLMLFELESCFKLPTVEKDKLTSPSPIVPWLSTFLAYGICISIAGIVSNNFILLKPLWTPEQNELLVKFWAVILFYLLLMCFLRQFFLGLSELFKNPKVEKFIENYFSDTENSNARYKSIPLSVKLIQYGAFAIYSGIAWILSFLLFVELFDLQLFSALIKSLFVSAGELLVALLMLFLGYRFYAHQADKDSTHNKLSSLVLVCCVLLGLLIIGDSSIIISGITWLFVLVALWFFLIDSDKEKTLNFIAGIFLRLTTTSINSETKGFKIKKLGFFETQIIHSSGEEEIIKNSKLLSICSSFESGVSGDN